MISPYQVANEEHAWSKCRQCHLIMSTDTLCTYMLAANIESVLVCKSAREAHFEQANEYVFVGQPASDRCILVLYSCGRTKGLLARASSAHPVRARLYDADQCRATSARLPLASVYSKH